MGRGEGPERRSAKSDKAMVNDDRKKGALHKGRKKDKLVERKDKQDRKESFERGKVVGEEYRGGKQEKGGEWEEEEGGKGKEDVRIKLMTGRQGIMIGKWKVR